MLKKRVIPILLWKDGFIVQARQFSQYQRIGKLRYTLERYHDWSLDELILLNISVNQAETDRAFRGEVSELRRLLNMPLTLGGGVSSLHHFESMLAAGADKVLIGTNHSDNLELIQESAKTFGSQAVVCCLDIYRAPNSEGWAMGSRGQSQYRQLDGLKLKSFVDAGAGELVLQSQANDGLCSGAELDLLRDLIGHIKIPVIIAGGVGSVEDARDVFAASDVSAVAIGNKLLHSELSYPRFKLGLQRLTEEALRAWSSDSLA